jgi:hypothetical protein
MIVVTIDLVSGRTGACSRLGRLFIWNTLKNASKPSARLSQRADYGVAVMRKDHPAVMMPVDQMVPMVPRDGVIRTFTVPDYPGPAYNVWRLVLRALRGAFPEEKG